MSRILIILVVFVSLLALDTDRKLSEDEKINYLIENVEKLDSCRFWRNGNYYSPQKAADHLRLKLDHWDEDLKTVTKFIEKLASQSSWSGISYKIVYDDGREIETKLYLNNLLENLEMSVEKVGNQR